MIKKVEPKHIRYFDLYPLLSRLESERPGITKRIPKHLHDDNDIQFDLIKGRTLAVNLFYYGVGDEYPTKYIIEHPHEIEHCKKIHPEAFIKGTLEYEIRLDLNCIWSTYDIDGEEIEQFYIEPNW